MMVIHGGKMKFTYEVDIPAEDPERYRPGGYHPTLPGDTFKDGRYKVLHKLGFGGFGIVWAARDLRDKKYVALKIATADPTQSDREVEIAKTLSELKSEYSPHVVTMLDHFQHTGPNGTHNCLVLEMLSEDLPYYVGESYRLPGKVAKKVARQALLGLNFLHQNNIAHGDLHARNLCFKIPSIHNLSEEELLQKLRQSFSLGEYPVKRYDGKPLEANVPEYFVPPRRFPVDLSLAVKIIDFGQAFTPSSKPEKLQTPLYLQSPELVLNDQYDYRVDLWAMGCMLFEIFTGEPPFDGDTLSFTPYSHIEEACELVGEELPERWQTAWKTLKQSSDDPDDSDASKEVVVLEPLFMECYNTRKSKPEEGEGKLTKKDLDKIAEMIKKLMRLEPSERAEVAEVLEDPWWDE